MKTILAVLFTLIASLAFCQQPRQATLAQQKICSEQAHKVFNEDYGSEGTGVSLGMSYAFTSHYAAQSHVCYIWVHGYESFKRISDDLVVADDVFDAFEGRSYASYEHIVPLKDDGKFHEPVDCEVHQPSHPTERCHSSEEFEILVDKYFGVGR